MAGHNKWSKVKHIKAKTDAIKGKQFSKVVREIIVAAKQGGGDPDMNPSLRLAIQKAKDVNMPKDNVKRAIEKGVGGGEGTDLEEITYEAYGVAGVAVLIETLTDNRNRTVPNLRAIVNKAGGSMANSGAVSYLFKTKGVLVFDSESDEEKVMTIALDHGSEDVISLDDGGFEVLTTPDVFESVRLAFEKENLPFISAELTKIPDTTIELDEAHAKTLFKMIDTLEEDDDVQNVYANYSVSDAVMSSLSKDL